MSSRTFLAQIDLPLVSVVVKLVLVYFDRYAIHVNRITILPATKRGGQEVAGGSIGLGDDSGEAIVGEKGIAGATNSIKVVISRLVGKTFTNYKYIYIIEEFKISELENEEDLRL